MDCTEFQTIVAGEREEDLSVAEAQGFESHMDACAVCREAVSRAEEDLERLGQLADPPLVAASAWSRVDDAVRAEARNRPGRENPFAPLAPEAPAVLAPAMPVTLARGGAEIRSKPLLAFVACVAAAVVVGVFLAFELPARGPFKATSGETALKVKPPETDDVVVKDVKAGKSYQQLHKQGTLVFVEGQ
jgi:hypothetical protein